MHLQASVMRLALSLFIAVAGTVLTSSNGGPWQTQLSGVDVDLHDVVWAGHAFVAVGDAVESVGTVVTSRDGVVWTRAGGSVWLDQWTVASNGEVVVTSAVPT